MRKKLEIVDGPFPMFKQIAGLSFTVCFAVAGREMTPEEADRRMVEAERLVRGWNLLSEAA